jgi:diazepam-binding inhibitor (GABA receptor modulating acyl-CoA-binding protein)
LQTRFHAAAESVKTFKAGKSVPNDDKLKVYGLFKQATIGDVNTDRPGGFLNFEANAKWDAWNALKGKSKDAAMTVRGAALCACVGCCGIRDLDLTLPNYLHCRHDRLQEYIAEVERQQREYA